MTGSRHCGATAFERKKIIRLSGLLAMPEEDERVERGAWRMRKNQAPASYLSCISPYSRVMILHFK
jgi:hypothetical protein